MQKKDMSVCLDGMERTELVRLTRRGLLQPGYGYPRTQLVFVSRTKNNARMIGSSSRRGLTEEPSKALNALAFMEL